MDSRLGYEVDGAGGHGSELGGCEVRLGAKGDGLMVEWFGWLAEVIEARGQLGFTGLVVVLGDLGLAGLVLDLG